MPDTFAITIIFIVIVTLIGAFIKGRSKDRCLLGFSSYPATVELTSGKTIWGKLRVENAGMEFFYPEPYLDEKEKHVETSYILYKNEYGNIRAVIRYIDGLGPKLLKLRSKELERTRRPRWHSRLIRKVRNVFGTVRDSLLEVSNLFVGRITTASPAGNVLKGQDKYTSSIQQHMLTAMGTSYEPMLEKSIGKKVVLAVSSGDEKMEYSGVLKDYTTEFITLMDTEYKSAVDEAPRKADIVVPRVLGVVRHLGG
ncbi:MAG: hypothetical protein PVH45_04180 [Candidatus Omnitrophota bacterium]|jgi:hypothetical protein